MSGCAAPSTSASPRSWTSWCTASAADAGASAASARAYVGGFGLSRLTHCVRSLENNGLLFCVLTTLGFTVALRHARTWARCESYSPSAPPCARQHMVLVVKVGAIDYLCDVGLGAGGPAAPLALDDSGVETPLCGELFRLQRGDPAKGEDSWLLWAVQQGAWRLLHSFEHVDQSCPRAHPADFLMCSFFMQFAPGTLFRTQRYISKPTPGGRALLLFRELRLKGFERVGVPPTTQVTRVDTPAQLVDAARDHFNVELPLQDAEALLAAGDGPLA